MQGDVKYSDLKIISTIEQTHQESTTIQLVKLKNKLLVCKVFLNLLRLSKNHILMTRKRFNIYKIKEMR